MFFSLRPHQNDVVFRADLTKMTFFLRRPHQNDGLIACRCCDVSWVFVEISNSWSKIGGFSLKFWIFVESGWPAG